ncbi:MAG: TRAP transporter small permease [Calditrichaeota bacterium]|nr:TRAP transporter small permease [Calditrichota bacterium]
MKRLLKLYDIGSFVCFCAMFLCIIVEVISRNLIKMPTTWAEELSRFFCVWSVFLGSASAWYRGAHITIVSLYTRCTGIARQSLVWTVDIICAAFLTAIWVGTIILMYKSYENKTTALEISISFFYLGLLAGLTGMLIFHFQRMIANVKLFICTSEDFSQKALFKG